MGTPPTAGQPEPRTMPAGQDGPQPVTAVTGTSAVRGHREAAGMHPSQAFPQNQASLAPAKGSSPVWAGRRAHHLCPECLWAGEDCVPIYVTWGNALLFKWGN